MSNHLGGAARPYVVWAVALSVYLLAVFHRSSLAVAGLLATERFGITAAQLATFVMLQLAVYAAMQVPVGLLVDRFGSRSVLTAGVVVMSLAQSAFAFADTYALALVARLFVGMGDALTFICVLRLVSSWFPPRRVPLVSQLTGTVGQLGAVVAAVPMTVAFRELGWTTTYLLSASVGALLLVGLLLVVGDTPEARHLRGASLSWREVRASLAASWTLPATRLGFWMHFVTQFSATTLGLLWGYPFLVRGEGLSEAAAGALLTLMVLVMMVAGPTLGWLVGTFPYQRSTMVLGIVGTIVLVWSIVLAWPGDAPLPLLVLLVVVTGVGGPASMIGFDVARTANPVERLASATGLVNQGGFIATLSLVIGIGLVLDWRTPGGGTTYTSEAFRWAMSLQYVLWTLGLTQVWRLRRLARAHAAAAATV
ncbi:MAG: MFS transporter [Nocardioides alkalitolerans]